MTGVFHPILRRRDYVQECLNTKEEKTKTGCSETEVNCKLRRGYRRTKPANAVLDRASDIVNK
jgi:hypothetical protein